MDTNTYTQNPTDRIDEQALLIADQIIAGTRDESEGRWAILSLLLGADIPASVLKRGSYANMLPQVRLDVADKLLIVLERKVLQTEPQPFLDLALLTEKRHSICGWARSLMRTAAGGAVRDVATAYRNTTYVAPMAEDNDESFSATSHAYLNAAVTFDPTSIDDGAEFEDEASQIEERFAAEAHGSRDQDRIRLGAAALREAFDLPEAIRPTDVIDREWVRTALTVDETAAHAAAAALLALITDVQSPAQAQIDERLLAMWDDYTVTQLGTLTEKPARVAAAIAQAAMLLEAKPNREAVAAAAATVRTLVPDTADWRRAARQLIDSYVAAECEARSDWDRRPVTAEETEKRMTDALAFDDRLTLFTGSHLGGTPAKVRGTVQKIVRATAAGASVDIPAERHVNA